MKMREIKTQVFSFQVHWGIIFSVPLKNWKYYFDGLGKNQETLGCVGLDLIKEKEVPMS